MIKARKTRRLDAVGMLFLALLAALALTAGAALMEYAHWTKWGVAIGAFVCVAFIAVGLPSHIKSTPRNTHVHGAARPASEAEAHAVARGDRTGPALHDRTFSD